MLDVFFPSRPKLGTLFSKSKHKSRRKIGECFKQKGSCLPAKEPECENLLHFRALN